MPKKAATVTELSEESLEPYFKAQEKLDAVIAEVEQAQARAVEVERTQQRELKKLFRSLPPDPRWKYPSWRDFKRMGHFYRIQDLGLKYRIIPIKESDL